MRRRSAMRNRRGSVLLVWIVVIFAVASGYTASKYVAVPLMVSYRTAVEERMDEIQQAGDSTEEQNKQTDSQGESDNDKAGAEDKKPQKPGTAIVEGKQDIPEESAAKVNAAVSEQSKEGQAQPNALSGLYCIQFGSFTTRNAAETNLSELAGKNIPTFIKEKDGVFKVFSIPYDSKDKAKAAAAALSQQVPDIFVVAV